jgi:hypothetical protein
VAKAPVYPRYDAQRVADLLDSPEVRGLIAELQKTRQTGRPGDSIRSICGAAPALGDGRTLHRRRARLAARGVSRDGRARSYRRVRLARARANGQRFLSKNGPER